MQSCVVHSSFPRHVVFLSCGHARREFHHHDDTCLHFFPPLLCMQVYNLADAIAAMKSVLQELNKHTL